MSFAFMPTQAMSGSISAMTAQNLGAGRLDRALQATRIGIVFSVIITSILFVLIQLYPAPILRIFDDDPQMIESGVMYIKVFSIDLLLIPFIFCINGFLLGGGHTIFTLISNILTSVVFRVPVCYIFGVTLGWGISGIGLGAPAASLGTLLIVAAYLFTGRWKENAVQAAA
jgi:Na+-driven multidrug efflux pump